VGRTRPLEVRSVTYKKARRVKRKPIVIAIPMEKYVYFEFWPTLLKIEQQPGDTVITQALARTDLARNDLVNAFLRREEATHILFLDSDQLYPPDIIDRLIRWRKPIVGNLYFHRQPPYNPHMYRYCYEKKTPTGDPVFNPVEVWKENELIECDAIGTGGLLIERRIFTEVVKPPWFEYGGNWDSEDITFCRKVRAAGVPIYCDTSCESGHIAEFIVGHNQFNMWKSVREGKISPDILKGVL
jgi:hypothetical protein